SDPRPGTSGGICHLRCFRAALDPVGRVEPMRVVITVSRRVRRESRAKEEGAGALFPPCSLRALREVSARRAFTVTESIVAIGLLLVIAGLLAELGVTSLAERQRNSGRQQAQEAAVNILEAARAC